MSSILTADDYSTVRELVGADEAILPDEVLDEFTFIDLAEAEVKAAVSDWETIIDSGDGSDYVFLRCAAVFVLARKVAHRFWMSIQYGHGFSFGGYSESAKMVNWEAVMTQLAQWASEAISGISTFSLTRPQFFIATGPTSSGANVPSEWETWVDRIIPRVVDWIEEDGEDDTEV